jgi:hypothetical protein
MHRMRAHRRQECRFFALQEIAEKRKKEYSEKTEGIGLGLLPSVGVSLGRLLFNTLFGFK